MCLLRSSCRENLVVVLGSWIRLGWRRKVDLLVTWSTINGLPRGPPLCLRSIVLRYHMEISVSPTTRLSRPSRLWKLRKPSRASKVGNQSTPWEVTRRCRMGTGWSSCPCRLPTTPLIPTSTSSTTTSGTSRLQSATTCSKDSTARSWPPGFSKTLTMW